MDHFLSGLDHGNNPWYGSRSTVASHEFAIGNSKYRWCCLRMQGRGLVVDHAVELEAFPQVMEQIPPCNVILKKWLFDFFSSLILVETPAQLCVEMYL